ncbi:MAG: hypothetical protein ACT4PX_10870 [Actinomycetota bacterium]
MDGERLTDDETALVLRRAAELDHELALDPGGLDPDGLEEVAVEAGLSRESVRRALAELRVGVLAAPSGRTAPSRRLLGPASVAVRRSVPAGAAAAEACVREFLERQLFQVRRDAGGRSLWTRREDLKASVQRSVDSKVQRRLVLVDVCEVQLAVVPEPGPGPQRSLVHVQLDVREVRRAHGAWLATGGVVGAAALGGSLALAGLDLVTAAAVPLGAGAVAFGHRTGSGLYRRRVRALETAVHGLLDGLERPARHRSGDTAR